MMRLVAAAILASALAGAQTLADCQNHKRHGRNPEARACYTQLSRGANPYLRAEGLWGLGDINGANEQFRQAVSQQPKNPDIRVRWGRLFLERYNPPEAHKLFEEALEIKDDHPGALVGLGLVASESFEAKAQEFADKALKVDPKNVEAQELLARLALEDINFEKARVEAEKALKMSPEAIDAMAVLATLDLLNDKQGKWFAEIARINPVYSSGYEFIGHQLSLNRRYLDAIEYFKKALEFDPSNWSAHSELGVTYMRLGIEGPARTHLETAHNNGWRDSQTSNSLSLMDTYKKFTTFKTPRSELRLEKKEADLLKLYIQPELERAIATYEKKYKYPFKEVVKLEVYPNHDDFAVRTMGMPGLGALGVTFGDVVAMDSPSGRPPGSFHWASTLWHELSHVFVLSATKNRVPRWFTEGLAVHEETAVAPDWGDRLDPTVLRVVKDKKLLPIAQLDRGFIRPTYPQQVIVSYFQGGRIIDFIVEKWGFQKVLDMMNAFARNTPTVEVVEKQLGVKPEEFDKQFLSWLDRELAVPLARFEEWTKKLRPLSAAVKEKRWDDVIKDGTEIRDWFTDYVEAGNVYEALATAYEAKGDKKAAAAELERYAKVGGRRPESLKKLATLYEEAGKPREAMGVLNKLNFIYPVGDPDMHRKFGEISLNQGVTNVAIREFQASIASKPIDVAAAHYNLARAFVTAQRFDEASDEVLLALEAAPGFRPAQKLLLELNTKEKVKK